MPRRLAAADMLPVRIVASKARSSAEEEVSIDLVYRLIVSCDGFINALVMRGVQNEVMPEVWAI